MSAFALTLVSRHCRRRLRISSGSLPLGEQLVANVTRGWRPEQLTYGETLDAVCVGPTAEGAMLNSAVADLLHRFDLSRTPSLVEPRLKRTVEAQQSGPALAGDGLHPVVFLADRSLRSEIDIH